MIRATRTGQCLLVAALVVSRGAAASSQLARAQALFDAPSDREAIARITVQCDACAWDIEGREGVVLAIALDDRPLHHLPLVRAGRAEYRVLLGSVERGEHTVRIHEDANLTARELRGKGAAVVERVSVDQIDPSSTEYRAISMAPFVYARSDTVGRFTDVPVFMWYEIEPASRGTRYRYSVIFTNEDGGTPADRLMATWGRTTDIEYIYSVEIDPGGTILAEDMQGPEHEILPFRGARDGRHPLLWVATDNNMVLDRGTTSVRYAPAPMAFPLRDVSREAVMDAHPWLYDVMTKELAREGKIADAGPGNGTIPHPRRFAFLEGCGDLGGNALAFEVRVGDWWISSDRGMPDYRIVRDGCFRAAVPLPPNVGAAHIRGLRAQAFPRAGKPTTAPVRFRRLNTLFLLDDQLRPGPSLLKWQGAADLRADGAPLEIPIP